MFLISQAEKQKCLPESVLYCGSTACSSKISMGSAIVGIVMLYSLSHVLQSAWSKNADVYLGLFLHGTALCHADVTLLWHLQGGSVSSILSTLNSYHSVP